MKKQIVSLVFSAAIFTTNPLFAMESEVEDPSPYNRQSIAEQAGRGNFAQIEDKITQAIIEKTENVLNVACTSKAMFHLSQGVGFFKMFSEPTASYTMSIAKLTVLFAKENGEFTIGKRRFKISNINIGENYLENCAPEAQVWCHPCNDNSHRFSSTVPIVIDQRGIKNFFTNPEYRKKVSIAMRNHALVTNKILITPLEDPK